MTVPVCHVTSFKKFGLIVDVAFHETALDQDPLTSWKKHLFHGRVWPSACYILDMNDVCQLMIVAYFILTQLLWFRCIRLSELSDYLSSFKVPGLYKSYYSALAGWLKMNIWVWKMVFWINLQYCFQAMVSLHTWTAR